MHEARGHLSRFTAVYRADKVIVHHSYEEEFNTADIALVKLTEELKFNENVKPVCLPIGGNRLTSTDS